MMVQAYLGGVQSKIKQQFPCAIYTHCMAHRLNLIVVDLCKGIMVLISLRLIKQ
jgi:hypothetical protein